MGQGTEGAIMVSGASFAPDAVAREPAVRVVEEEAAEVTVNCGVCPSPDDERQRRKRAVVRSM
jgi:hypothetical protein